MKNRWLILLLSLLVGLVLWFLPLFPQMPLQARHALALSITAVIWWAFQVIPPAFTAMLLIAAFVVLRVADAAVVFSLWTRPLIWLIIASFLLSEAVNKSGLAARIALYLLGRFATSHTRAVVLIYVLAAALSLIIPHPFPRALLLMAVVRQVIRLSGKSQKTAASLGFAVFASMTATSMFFLTGDVLLNTTTLALASQQITWLRWFVLMAVPALAASVLMCGLHLLVFRRDLPYSLDQAALEHELNGRGALSAVEKSTLFWVLAAVLLWITGGWTGLDPAWAAVLAVIGLSLPVVGRVLENEDITRGVHWPVILFLSGAFAIGAVSSASGLSVWLAETLLPARPPANPFLFAVLIAGSAMTVHLLVGSALATLSVVIPPLVAYASLAGWHPLFPALLANTVVVSHFLLPFHNVTLMIGDGETGGYGPAETMRYGLPLTLVTWGVVLAVEVPWWMLVGLI